MPASAYYLQKALTTLLDKVWDPTARHANGNVFEDIVPLPPTNTPSEDLVDAASMRPVNKLLQAQDPPAIRKNKVRGHDFVTTSATVNAMQHRRECSAGCQGPHEDMLVPGNKPGFNEYRVQWQYNPGGFSWGAGHVMPEHLPEYLRRALLMQNMCDWAVFVLQYCVEMVVEQLGLDAEVFWMTVVPRRRLQLVFHGCTVAWAHSVLFIRSRKAGNFVLDPTIEQYGHPREHRFLAWKDYKKRYIMRPSKWGGEAVWSTRTSGLADWLEKYPCWAFWGPVKDVIDRQVGLWLLNRRIETTTLRRAMDFEGYWKREEENLELSVMKEVSQLRAALSS